MRLKGYSNIIRTRPIDPRKDRMHSKSRKNQRTPGVGAIGAQSHTWFPTVGMMGGGYSRHKHPLWSINRKRMTTEWYLATLRKGECNRMFRSKFKFTMGFRCYTGSKRLAGNRR